ncbi:MAG: VWA domain-containing protein [Planctomycetaceae bacterium]
MLTSQKARINRPRRGIILVLGAILMVAVFAFVAFTVDIGYMAVVRTQLQGAADAAALGSAQDIPAGAARVTSSAKSIAALNKAAGAPVSLDDSDIELGFFDYAQKTFVVNPSSANAVRVTASVQNQKYFFAQVMGNNAFDMQATSIGMLNPRDVVFVVDLSGSMNDDTEPCWATDALTATYSPLGYPDVATDLMQDLYTDFGFGAFPGQTEYLGAPLGAPENGYAIAEITRDDGPLTSSTLPSQYRILNTDEEWDRRRKSYAWIIDYQLARLMPAAKPAPDSSQNFEYWSRYIDYLMEGAWVGTPPPTSTGGGGGTTTPPTSPSPPPPPTIGNLGRPLNAIEYVGGRLLTSSMLSSPLRLSLSMSSAIVIAPESTYPGCPRRGSNEYIWVPWYCDNDRIYQFNNPNKASFPSASVPWYWRNRYGYRTYVQFMLDWGRERSPEFDNSENSNPGLAGKTPLSILSPDCPLHTESTAGGTFQFPPRTQPMHSVRRSLIAGLQVIQDRNQGVAAGAGDRVAIVTFDGRDQWHAPSIVQPLTDDFESAKRACTTLQAAGDIGATTSTESGLALARQHLTARTSSSNPSNDPLGPQGRKFTSKVIILLTDGMPNSWEMDAATLEQYMASEPSAEFYPAGYDWFNSALAQTQQFFMTQRGKLYSVGMGLGTDYDFMDRLARIASTDNNGISARSSGNPAEYESQLTEILKKIIDRPGSKLVR